MTDYVQEDHFGRREKEEIEDKEEGRSKCSEPSKVTSQGRTKEELKCFKKLKQIFGRKVMGHQIQLRDQKTAAT